MPQRQLPIFPAGVTEINHSIAVQKEAGQVVYIHGHLPVFHHEEKDIGSFRMFTSQMIVNGTVKPNEIVKAFGVPVITVKRYVKVFRDHGAKGFYETKTRQSSASVLKGEVMERARMLLEELRSQYTLGYQPTRALDGRFRRVTVEAVDDNLTLRHRAGYLATPHKMP